MQLSYEIGTRVFLEEDALANHSTLFQELGSRALVVMDADLPSKHVALQELFVCLEMNGIERILYHHTKKMGTGIANVEAGAALARESKIDLLIAIGCEATLEAGKAIALLAVQDIAEASLLIPQVEEQIPVVCLPIGPGGGTEVTPEVHVAQTGLSRLTLVENRLLMPQIAFLDPRYLAGSTHGERASALLLTLGRAIESLSSVKAHPISDAMAIATLGSVSDFFKRLTEVDKPWSLDEDAQLLLTANQAGLAVAMTGTNALEALASPLTYVLNITLGQAYGLMIPPYLAYLLDRQQVTGDVILQSLYVPDLDALQEKLWDIIGPIDPMTEEDLEQVVNAAQNNPRLKQGTLGFDLRDLTNCYAHLLADETEVEADDVN